MINTENMFTKSYVSANPETKTVESLRTIAEADSGGRVARGL